MRSSKAKMSAADENLRIRITDTISIGSQFLRFGNREFITISTDQQFLRLSFSETITISTLHNFNGRAQRALKKMRYNFDRFAISTFWISAKCNNFNVATISTFWKIQFRCNFNVLAISTFGIYLEYNNFDAIQFRYWIWR